MNATEQSKRQMIHQLMFFCGATSAVSLLLAFIGFGFYEYYQFKKETHIRLISQMDIVTYQVATPLLFDDKNEADAVLASLSADPLLKRAIVYDKNDAIFAFIQKGDTQGLAKLSKDVIYQGERIGRVELGADYQSIWNRFKTYAVIMSVIFIVVFPVVVLISVPLRAQISKLFANQIVISDALAKSNIELERSNKDLEHFAYIASHDLQEPLRMISSYTQLLARRYQGRLDKDADEFIGFAVDGAKRMQDLINALLTYARVDTRGKPSEIVEGEKIFNDAIANLEIAIQESEARITHDPLPKLYVDPAQITQVFQNLIANAIKFCKDHTPCIHVGVESVNKQWRFSVKDNGIGIEAKYFEKLFALFQRLHTREEYPGTGIGLALCKKVIERHGGQIWVESEAGKGTTFLFLLNKVEA